MYARFSESSSMTLPMSRRVRSITAVFLALTAALCSAYATPELVLTNRPLAGALVDHVNIDGPAAKAGISAHDLITAVDGGTRPVQVGA